MSNQPATQPWQLGASDLVTAVRKGELSPVEIVDSLLQRCAQLDGDIRAWVTMDGERARERALSLTKRIATRPDELGALVGVPVGLKDVIYTAGLLTTASSRSLADFVPDYDAAATERLRDADAVILGKLHTAEFACADAPPTRNPWNLQHTPGGSSSGSGAAVAAGMLPVALGTQTVGSTLRPAMFNGIVGYKPTYGLVSNHGVIPLAWTFDHVGILARGVEDVEIVLAALVGHDPRDPASVVDAAQRFRTERVARTDAPRIGLVRDFFLSTCEPDVLDGLERTAAQFTAAGAQVEEVGLPPSFSSISKTMQIILKAETAAYHREAFATRGELYGPKISTLIDEGMRLSAAEYVGAVRERPALVAELEQWLSGFDALLTPTAPAPAPRNLSITGDASFLAPFSFAGLPAVSIPTGLNTWGLPLGAQLVGARWRDRALLATAAWCESAVGFSAHPPSW